jgi:hypothetical protein
MTFAEALTAANQSNAQVGRNPGATHKGFLPYL